MRTPAEIREAFSPADQIRPDKPFYLVGIGGAGMSSLAYMLQKRGIEVSGSDSTESPSTQNLKDAGINVRIGHSCEDIRTGCQVVLSDAIDLKNSPEVEAARNLGCHLFRRSQLLNWLLIGKKIIAVTGTHGKTTVTGMIGAGLRAAGMDPTIVVGAYVPEFGGSVIEGEGEYAVMEACEAYGALSDFEPYCAVLTNLESDHLDHHVTLENLVKSVKAFLNRIPSQGMIAITDGDYLSLEASKEAQCHVERVEINNLDQLEIPNKVKATPMSLPGKHNLQNAAQAAAICAFVEADPRRFLPAVTGFGGAERRLQLLANEGIPIIDDYAHHPTEVVASLTAIRERHASSRLIVVFQPHLYSRTAQFIPEFAKALSLADIVFLTDIYPARETPLPGISSARIAELVTKPAHYVPNRNLLPREVAKIAKKGDVVVGMGAGNISDFAPALIAELNRPQLHNAAKPQYRIAVILGGDSAEREVSLHSGREVLAALKTRGHDAFPLDIADVLLGKGDLKSLIGSDRPDLAFLATHGTNQEDGALQGLFELLHIPYTGSGIQASALAFDKNRSKEICQAHGLKVPRGQLVSHPGDSVSLEPPLIVKPNAQGSTVGLSFVKDKKDLSDAIAKALQYDSQALVEEWVQGMEISVPVLGERPLPIVEICPKEGQYDFANKYLPGATEEIIPARLDPASSDRAQSMALQAHQALGCNGATRTDFIVRDNKDPVILEVNTLPGLTGTSLLPNSAKAAGISFEDLVEWIVQDALARAGVRT